MTDMPPSDPAGPQIAAGPASPVLPYGHPAAGPERLGTGPGVPRCLTCGYVLVGLNDPRCPECGRLFNPWDPSTYNTRPPFMGWRYWMPGFILALSAGLLGFAAVVSYSGWGWSAVFVVPLCAGTILGYGVRVKWVVLPLLALLLLGGLLFGLVTMSFAGVYCGLFLAGMALGPILVGIAAGWVLREVLKRSRFSQRWHLPTLVSLLLPLLCAAYERMVWTPPAVETVRTSAVLDVPVGRAWDGMRFYEQVDERSAGPRPRVFSWHWVGLPRPLSTSGSVAAVGDRTTCVYDKGRLVKQVTARDEGRRLAFHVVEQGFETHSMRLVDGSFTFEPIDATHTRVTLETTYAPRMRPRWAWRPAEAFTVHTLHGYVLQGMEAQGRQVEWAQGTGTGGGAGAEPPGQSLRRLQGVAGPESPQASLAPAQAGGPP